MLLCLSFGGLIAQGPPVHLLDSCTVTSSVKFKTMPLPGKFQPGEIEAFRNCPNLGNCVIKVPNAKVAKARGLSGTMRIEGGQLREVRLTASDEKAFEKLYESLVDKAGTPSKLVESQGQLRYSWELRTKVKAHVEILQDPKTKRGTVIVKE